MIVSFCVDRIGDSDERPTCNQDYKFKRRKFADKDGVEAHRNQSDSYSHERHMPSQDGYTRADQYNQTLNLQCCCIRYRCESHLPSKHRKPAHGIAKQLLYVPWGQLADPVVLSTGGWSPVELSAKSQPGWSSPYMEAISARDSVVSISPTQHVRYI